MARLLSISNQSKWALGLLSISMGALVACQRSDQTLDSRYAAMQEKGREAEEAELEMARGTSNSDSHHGGEHQGQGEALDHHEAEHAKKSEHKKVTKAHHGSSHAQRIPASIPGNYVYVVQIGAFRVKSNADRLQQKLKAEVFPVIMHPLNHSKNGALFVVRMEPTPHREEAIRLQTDLKEKGSTESQVLVMPE